MAGVMTWQGGGIWQGWGHVTRAMAIWQGEGGYMSCRKGWGHVAGGGGISRARGIWQGYMSKRC